MSFGFFFEAIGVVMKVGRGRGVQKLLHLGYEKILGGVVGFKKKILECPICYEEVSLFINTTALTA